MEETESPLDVLSRAATMVQDSSPQDFDDSKRCPTKDLPTARWRRERRCRDRIGDYSKAQQSKSAGSNCSSVPALSAETLLGCTSAVPGDTPLDMSTRGRTVRGLPPSYSQSISVPGYRLPARPSVITCAPPAPTPPSKRDTRQGHRRELFSGMCDPVIDEHFRRSLGKDYLNLFTSDGHPVSSSSNNNNNNNNDEDADSESSITVTGLSVDDHFAKALGDTWVKLQGQNNANSNSSTTTSKESKTSLLQQRRGLVTI